MFIRSERLFLRPGWPEDWEEVFERIADEGLVRNLATAPWPYKAEDARQFLSIERDRRLPVFFVTLPGAKGAELIGTVGLSSPDGGDPELGYWIARDHWGRGYATEAVRAVLPLARVLGHRRLVASHFIDNPSSGKVLRKAGFRPTGDRMLRFSLARGEKAPALGYTLELDPPADSDVMKIRQAA